MNVGYFLIVSAIVKQKVDWTTTVALCIHMTVGYFLIVSAIVKTKG
jgi:hypothetical protein